VASGRDYHAAVRRLALAVVLTAALLVPAAAQAANPVLSAAKRSSTAKSAKLQLQMTTTAPGKAKTVLSGSGATSGRNVTLSVSTTVAGRRVPMNAIGVVENGAYVMYMRSPLFSTLPQGKTWLRIDLQAQGGSVGLDFGSLIGQAETLAPLAHGLVSTKRVAREQVAGRPTTRYRAVVDLRRAARAVPAYGKQLDTVERATGVRLGRVTQDVWVGADGRIRRLRTVTPTTFQGARASTVQTLTFLEYDVPVAIAAPPAAQVFNAS
jgi:hypothetical protein